MTAQSNPNKHLIIGCMSGTSLDGIDLVYVSFTKNKNWSFEILASKTYDYNRDWKIKLASAKEIFPADLKKLDVDYTHFLGGIILDFITQNKIKVWDAVASHGHTIFHQPEKGLTLQIGNLSKLAEQLGGPVICDFRVQDVALGGQGAPLVPMGDLHLFNQYEACLNLGGFSNLSVFNNQGVLAYDICAVNTVLNFLAHRLELPYDDGGKVARKGKMIPSFFAFLERLEFYVKKPPKSLGIEWVQASIYRGIDQYTNYPVEDLLHTYTLHIVEQIVKCLPEQGSVLVTGGGAYNTFLIEELQKKSRLKIVLPTPAVIDFKEALIFAFLGLLRSQGAVNCLASVTGAKQDHSSGKIFIPNSEID